MSEIRYVSGTLTTYFVALVYFFEISACFSLVRIPAEALQTGSAGGQ